MLKPRSGERYEEKTVMANTKKKSSITTAKKCDDRADNRRDLVRLRSRERGSPRVSDTLESSTSMKSLLLSHENVRVFLYDNGVDDAVFECFEQLFEANES